MQLLDLASIAIGVSTVIMSYIVAAHWFNDAVESMSDKSLSAQQWFILGVFISFTGRTINDLYTTVARSSKYISPDNPFTYWMYDNWIYLNLGTNQLLTIAAAFCHMQALYMFSHKGDNRTGRLLFGSLVIGIVFATFIFFQHGYWV